jgi:tetratricopeptide (TPR) repeat protein
MAILDVNARCNTRMRWVRRVASVVALAIAVFLAVPAAAQNAGDDDGESASDAEYTTPTPEQKRLNDQAVQALTYDNYAKAISFLEEALYIGELNVSYLNLGRAYQKLGECPKARAALESVPDAPKVAKPPPKFVEKKAREYLAELPEECPAESASGDAGAAEQSQADDEADDADEEAAPGETRWPIGVVAGGGFVLAGGALAMFAASTIRADAESQAANAPENGYTQSAFVDAERRANTLGAAGVGAAAVGALATGIGVYLLMSDSEPGQTQPEAVVSVAPSTDGASAIFRISF